MHLADIRRALVVGAATMGRGIAQVYAIAGFEVDLTDNDPAALDRARELIRSSLHNLVEFGAVAAGDLAAVLGRIHTTTDLAAVAPRADVVTEAIVEDRAAKTALFIELDGLLRPDVLIASNTSGLDVFSLLRDATPVRMPRMIIHHYFLPATIIPLVEVVAGPETSRATVDLTVALLTKLGRVPVVLEKFHENFIVNSYQIALAAVTARLLAEGVATPEAIDQAVKHSLGIRLPVVGVVQSLDFTGLDLFARILRNSGLDASYYEALVAEGRTGVKAGKGLYDYGDRPLSRIEAERDRKYWANYQNLRNIGAFDPV
jgi:3-hydroxybutyryl-CoA dehydrogenase